MITLGALLREKRERASLTVRDVGGVVGISYSLVSKFENGSRIPTPVILQKLNHVLQMNDEESQTLMKLRNPVSTTFTEKRGGAQIKWKVIEINKEFKSIYPTI